MANMIRSWWPCTRLEWAFFAATAGQAVVVTVIQMQVKVCCASFSITNKSRRSILAVYLRWVNIVAYEVPVSFVPSLTLVVTTLGAMYQLILTLDAYRIKNNIQLLMLCACNICLSIAATMQYGQISAAKDNLLVGHNRYNIPFAKNDWKFWEHVAPGLITCIVISCICSISMCAIAFMLEREFSWVLYQQVSPDARIRQRYFCYQIYLILLKFSPFFLIAFIVVYNMIDVHYDEPEYSLTMAIIPTALLILGLAVYFVRVESRVGMAIALFGNAAEVAYLISRVIVLHGTSQRARTWMKGEIVFLALVALVLNTLALVAGCICFANFGKGLKPFVLGQVSRKTGLSEQDEAYYFQRLNYNIPTTPASENRRFDLD